MKVIPRSIKQVPGTLNRLTRACLHGLLREFQLQNILPRVLDGCYSLARDIKSVLFSLGTLSSCREPPVHLGIEKEHPKLLILQSTRKEFSWSDNRFHKSIALTNVFPSKRKSALRYDPKYPLIKCSSHLVNSTGFNPNWSALEFWLEPYNSILFENTLPLKAPMDTILCIHDQNRVGAMPPELMSFEYVTPRPTDSTGEFENLSDEAEELCRSELKKCLRVPEEQAPLKGLDV